MTTEERTDAAIEEHLQQWEAPSEAQSEERSWKLASADFSARPQSARRRVSLRVGLAGLLAAALAGVALTPAGAKVSDLVADAVGGDKPPAEVRLGGFPHVGPLLVRSSSGIWIVEPDGSRRPLGGYHDAVWSPHGQYIAATSKGELTALSPEGDERWSVAVAPPVADPAWSESGFRIAYLSGGEVRVVAGDGTGDASLAEAARVGPVWRPPPESRLASSIDGVGTHQLTYADRRDRIHLVDTDTGAEIWRSPAGALSPEQSGAIVKLTWSADGSRLLVEYRHGYGVFRRDGSPVVGVPGSRIGAVELSPDGTQVAMVVPKGNSRMVVLESSRPGGQPVKTVLSGHGPIHNLSWAPNGRWLAVEWGGADNWIFIRPSGKAVGVGDIAGYFHSDDPSFPRITDWCCRAR